MGLVASWLSIHWFNLLQTIGIVGGLIYNGYSLRLNARVRRVETLFKVTEQQRSIWLKLVDPAHLKRLLHEHVNLDEHPLTNDEELFVNLLLLHFEAVLEATRSRVFKKPAGMDVDVRAFLSLPIPNAAWNKLKEYRDARTIRYVEGFLRVR